MGGLGYILGGAVTGLGQGMVRLGEQQAQDAADQRRIEMQAQKAEALEALRANREDDRYARQSADRTAENEADRKFRSDEAAAERAARAKESAADRSVRLADSAADRAERSKDRAAARASDDRRFGAGENGELFKRAVEMNTTREAVTIKDANGQDVQKLVERTDWDGVGNALAQAGLDHYGRPLPAGTKPAPASPLPATVSAAARSVLKLDPTAKLPTERPPLSSFGK